MKRIRSEFRSLLQPDLRWLAMRCILTRILYLPAVIIALPAVGMAVLQICVSEVYKTSLVLGVPFQWVSDTRSAQYEAARSIKNNRTKI